MQTSIESFLLINFALDVALMSIVSKGSGSFRLSRIILSALICTCFGLLAACYPDPWYSPVIQLILLIPLAMLITGSSDIRLWGGSALMLMAGIMLAGGSERLFASGRGGKLPALAAALTGLLMLYMLLAHRRRLRSSWSIDLCLSAGGATVRFRALVDTGNRLHEPLSGLPVIIAEKEVLEDILPETGYRSVAYGGLGGNGVLSCFRPDFIWIVSGKKMRRAPEAWVAVSPAPLPGMSRALAPCEFASL